MFRSFTFKLGLLNKTNNAENRIVKIAMPLKCLRNV